MKEDYSDLSLRWCFEAIGGEQYLKLSLVRIEDETHEYPGEYWVDEQYIPIGALSFQLKPYFCTVKEAKLIGIGALVVAVLALIF